MLERLFIAGSGGQGIILLGRLLATASVQKIKHVTFLPAYGAEVRGGTSNCSVVLSSGEISSPVPEELDTMIIMNQASLDRFLPMITGDCLLLINSSMCKVPSRRGIIAVRATDLANQLGNTKTANFIMLGAYLARKPVVPPSEIEKGIVDVFSGKNAGLTEINRKAFQIGLES